MERRSRDDHLFGPGPKRILALDGGGIRGVLSIQILKRIEEIIQSRADGEEVRLCDYFDLIGGTSTGAIIAAGLALGFEVQHLDELYRELGEKVFKRSLLERIFRPGAVRSKFPAEPLRAALENEFRDIRLGDEEVFTGLAIVAKRLDTGSPWVLHNNPRGKYFSRRPGGKAVPNSEYLLRNVVRASTAAPHYFDPERIQVSQDTLGAFVDGGVSPYNNPSLQLLFLATLTRHEFRWPLGEHSLLVVSVGTGAKEPRLDPDKVMKMPAAALSLRSLLSMMADCSALAEILLQWLSTSPTARVIDREVGDLGGDILGGGEPWLTYLRYDAELELDWLEGVGLKLSSKELESLHKMDKPENIKTLTDVGRAAAKLVKEDHFPPEFDIT